MAQRTIWRVTFALAVAAGGVISLFQILWQNFPTYRGDWQVFWYFATEPVSPAHPSAYPPTAILLLRPFGLLAKWPSFAAWSIVGPILFVIAARRMGASKVAVAVALAMPAAMLCLVAGQTSLFVGAALMAGVAVRDWRWSGILFGLAMAVKPQAAIAVPIALLAIGDWRRLLIMGAAGVAAIGVTILLWGVPVWIAWIEALPRFQAILVLRHLDVMDVGVNGMRLWLGWPSWVNMGGVVLGAVAVAATWRGTREPMTRYAALACGAVLISPYTLPYDLAGLSVVAVAALIDPERRPADWLIAAPIVAGVWPNVGVIGLGCLLAWRYRAGVVSGLEAIGLRRGLPNKAQPIARP